MNIKPMNEIARKSSNSYNIMKHVFFLIVLFSFVCFSNASFSISSVKKNIKRTNEIIFTENFNVENSAWIQYSVASNKDWHYSSSADQITGRNSTAGMIINNYGGDVDSEDWLISPKLTLSELDGASISYWLLSKYSGSSIEILYSYDYAGAGNPNLASWVSLQTMTSFPTSWTEKFIDLSSLTSDVYIAFKHTSGTSANNSAAICIDDFTLQTGSSANNGEQIDANTLSHSETFDVVSWNVEWFGAPQKSGHASSFSQQLAAVSSKIIELDADIYTIQELVTDDLNGNFLTPLLDELNSLAGAGTYAGVMGPRYSYDFVAPSTDYPAQRLCFIYNTHTVSPVTSYSMFSDLYPNNNVSSIAGYTGSASSFFASGRLPFLLSANVTIAGVEQNIKLVNVHAKCCSDSYSRKLADALFLINELNTNYTEDNLIVLGDYNDFLNGSMSGGESPYASWFTTTEMVNHVLTSSTNIDHITISNELYDEFESLTNNTSESSVSISDHKPIMLRLKFDTPSTQVNNNLAFAEEVKISPNPSQSVFNLRFRESDEKIIYLLNSKGQTLEEFKAKEQIGISLNGYEKGFYFLKIISSKGSFTERIVKL